MPTKDKKKVSLKNKKYYAKTGYFKQKIARLRKQQIRQFEERNPMQNGYELRSAIVKHYGKFDHNTVFVGTIDPSKLPNHLTEFNERIAKYNDKLPVDRQDLQLIQVRRNFNADSFARYAEKFISLLLHEKLIDRGLITIEQTSSRLWHCHITMNLSRNILPINIKPYWLLGECYMEPPECLEAVLWYQTKDLKKVAKNIIDLDKSQYWFPHGNYDKSTLPVDTKQIQNQNKALQVLENFRVQNQLKQLTPSVTNNYQTLALC